MNLSYIHTDLAAECRDDAEAGGLSGVRYSENEHGSLSISRIEILDEGGERALGKPKGVYVTLTFPDLRYSEDLPSIRSALAEQIRFLMDVLAPGAQTVLVVGLGNRRMIADAVGPQTTERILVTRHLRTLEPGLFADLGQRAVAAIAPGVLADTGVEAAHLVKKTVEAVCPDLVIAVDALAARHSDRLGCTVQLSGAGIAPGSGVGNARMALSRDTLGVPVLALGVPTVVNSATLVYDALEKAGVKELPEALAEVLENQRRFFVTPKDCDEVVDGLCDLLAAALDAALARGAKMDAG